MYEVGRLTDVFEVYELRDTATGSWLRICPERGGMVLSYAPYGREVLYLDRETFLDKEANVRGGIPVLWPICGPLQDGRYEWDGQTYSMANHGLARRFPWSVVSVETQDAAAMTLQLTSNEETRREFPFDFELTFRYQLRNGRLTISQTYANTTQDGESASLPGPMPMYAGFHPYFLTSSKNLPYQTDASHYLDYNDDTVIGVTSRMDLEDKVESIVFLDASEPRISFAVHLPDRVDRPGPNHILTDEPLAQGSEVVVETEPDLDLDLVVEMEYGHEFKYVVLWSVPGKPFICVEPWMALPKSLHSGEDVTLLLPGESLTTQLTLAVKRP